MALALIGGACGSQGSASGPSTDPASGTYQQGSRLRAHLWDAGGGATSFIDWYDSALSLSCVFADGEDGVRRCLPSADVPVPSLVYLDAACTQGARISKDGPLPAFAGTYAPTMCSGPRTAVHVEALELVTAVTYYQADGNCSPAAVPPGAQVYATRPVDLSMFLEADVAVEDRGGGLDVEVMRARDGSLELGRTLDHARGAACSSLLGRCLPPAETAPTALSYYADAACTEPVPGAFGCYIDRGCPPPAFALDEVVDPVTCAGSLAAVHALAPSPTFVYETQDSCVPAGVSQDVCGYFVETGPDVTAFPEISTIRLGAGRLQKPVFTAPSGRPVAEAGGFVDSQTGLSCTPAHFADGVNRCVVSAPTVTGRGLEAYYADDACTRPVAWEEVLAGCVPAANPTPYGLAWSDGSDGPPVIEHVYTVGDRVQGTIYAENSFTGSPTCFALPDANPGSYAALGPEIAFDSAFARLTETTASGP